MRLHFAPADLRRITLAPAANALWETALSVDRLRNGGRARPALVHWRRTVGGTAARHAGVLTELVPPHGGIPDFLLQPSAADFATGLELLAHVPADRLAADLRLLQPPLPDGPSRWVRALADGSPVARRTLATDLRRYHDSSVAPWWPHVRTDAAADRALRAEMLLRGGVDGLLTTLHPQWHWQPPTLHIPSPATYDIPLCGRGLLLLPSWFATGALVMYDDEQPTVLVHPMQYADATHAAPPADALGPLLGRTRAAVLRCLRDPATTTALAERADISLAAASQHASVLRNAGLITTTRTGTSVLHTLTPLGHALLGPRPPTPT